jgi:hypothetical protein
MRKRLILPAAVFLFGAVAVFAPARVEAANARTLLDCGASCSGSCCWVNGWFCNCGCDDRGYSYCDCAF